ncbi:hypothetical protein PSCICP_45940 [Pseudomonas cichorii]|uniref:Uncharacterized protein n=1 Tax=Pseudomonas cichorii TaxID=36746 RepID=A0ABQ1DUG8_PSECI|nr:hypothetical protein PSCICP_45940 [Pseudomonas cichorii]
MAITDLSLTPVQAQLAEFGNPLAQRRGTDRALIAQAHGLMLFQAGTQALFDGACGYACQLHTYPAPSLRVGLGKLFLLR